MKFKLPKSLMAVVLAITGTGIACADPYYDSIDEIIHVAGGETINRTTATGDAIPTVSHAVAKDGTGTLVLTGTTTEYSTIYVREGEMQIGDGQTETTVSFYPRSTNAQGRYNALSVGGKNAVLRFNKANATCNETANMVGGMNGNGTMIIENGSNVNFGGSNVFIIGDISVREATDPNTNIPDGYTNATTALAGASVDTADNLYKGTYTPAQNGSGDSFGRGEVIVKDGSYFKATYGNFWIGDGALKVEGEDTKVEIGLNGYGYRTWLGLGENTTSEITVKDGATMEVNASQFYSNYSDNSSSTITVDGAGSTFTIKDQTTADGEDKYNSAHFGANGENSSSTIRVTNGAALNLENDNSFFGWDGSDTINRTTTVEIGKDSSLYASDVTVNDGATVTNDGTISVSDAGYIKVVGKGEVTNNGSIEGDAWVYDGGTLVANDGSTLSRVFMGSYIDGDSDGTLIINGAVTMNGKLEQFGTDGVVIIFNEGSSLDMNGNSITLGNIQLVFNVDGTVDNSTEFSTTSFFKNYNVDSSDITDSTSVLVKGSDGSTTVRSVNDLNVVVPEPATATLSLLALAALAARRRRK